MSGPYRGEKHNSYEKIGSRGYDLVTFEGSGEKGKKNRYPLTDNLY